MMKKRMYSATVVSLLAIFTFSTSAISAEETPTNAELYQMFIYLQEDQESLKQEANQARAEATEAKQELAELKLEMETVPSSSLVKTQETDSGAYANLDFMYKRQVHDRLTYAQFGKDIIYNDNTNERSGKYEAVDIKTEYEPGFRIGLGYLSSRGAEGFVNFSYLATSSDSSVSATEPIPANHVGPNFLYAKLLPDSGLAFDQDDPILSASGSYDLHYRVLDAGFAQNLDIGDQLDLRFGGGLRYASINDDLSANYRRIVIRNVNTMDYSPQIIGTEIKNDFWGVGPRATVDATWHIPNTSGLSIFGGLGASLLYGKNEFSWVSQGQGTEFYDYDVVSFTNVETHLFPVAEASVGAGYSASFDTVSYDIRVGYEFETWFDALSRADFVDTTETEITREDTDLSLHGLFLRGAIKW